MRRTILISILFLVLSLTLYAGDIATYVDLGFSKNLKYYMFGQYGINENSLAYADIFTIDVSSNKFVSGGVLNEEYDFPIQAGHDGLGALLTLLREEGEPLAEKFDIHHMRTGRLVYILLNGEEPQEIVQFRDFQTGRKITVHLNQNTYGSGKEVSASYHFTVVIDYPSGKSENYTVGLPDFRRKGVKSYTLRTIFASPNDKALIFVVEKNIAGRSGLDIRYMVETLRLP